MENFTFCAVWYAILGSWLLKHLHFGVCSENFQGIIIFNELNAFILNILMIICKNFREINLVSRS